MLASNQYVMVKEAKKITTNIYETFLWDNKQLTIFLSVAGRPSRPMTRQSTKCADISAYRCEIPYFTNWPAIYYDWSHELP